MMPHDGGRGPDGAARTAVNLVGLLLETRTPLTFEQVRKRSAVPPGEGRQRQTHVRTRQGHPARLRRAAATGRHRRLGHGAGVHDPERCVLPPEIRHARRTRRVIRCCTRCPERHARRGSGAEADGGRGGKRAGRAGRWAARLRFGRPRVLGHGGRCGRAGPSTGRFGYRTARAPPRIATSTRSPRCSVPGTGTWWGSIASARRLVVPPVAVHLGPHGRGGRARAARRVPGRGSGRGRSVERGGRGPRDDRVVAGCRVVGHRRA